MSEGKPWSVPYFSLLFLLFLPRTTNPIESTFATVRLRTAKTRGRVSRASILSMVFKLAKSAEQRWLLLRGSELITKVIAGIQFKNGVITKAENHQRVAA